MLFSACGRYRNAATVGLGCEQHGVGTDQSASMLGILGPFAIDQGIIGDDIGQVISVSSVRRYVWQTYRHWKGRHTGIDADMSIC
jgi:hypothetical protein